MQTADQNEQLGLGFYKRQASVEQRFRGGGEYLACLAGEETSEENAGMVPGGRRRRRRGGGTGHYERCITVWGRPDGEEPHVGSVCATPARLWLKQLQRLLLFRVFGSAQAPPPWLFWSSLL